MALCGKNLSLDAVTDKIAEIESKITEKLDAVASVQPSIVVKHEPSSVLARAL